MSRVPNTESKARRKLGKILRTKDRIINQYPNLVDCTAITIDSHRVDTIYKTVVDTQYVDTLLEEYTGLHNTLRNAYKHLHKLQEDSLSNTLSIDLTESKIEFLKNALKSKRNEVIKEVLPDTTFNFEDSQIKARIILKDGEIQSIITKKEQQIIAPTSYDCSIHFWEDFKFWVLVALVIVGIVLRWNVRRFS